MMELSSFCPLSFVCILVPLGCAWIAPIYVSVISMRCVVRFISTEYVNELAAIE
jgi:hypothetical protein